MRGSGPHTGQNTGVAPRRGSGRRSFVPLEHSSSADHHLTQRNVELGGAARLSDKERFQNTCTAAGLSTPGMRTPRSCTTRCNLRNGHRWTTAIWNKHNSLSAQVIQARLREARLTGLVGEIAPICSIVSQPSLARCDAISGNHKHN